MSIRPIKNSILFTFIDPVNSKGEFERAKTSSGILLNPSVDDSAKLPRWATVSAAGPDCEGLNVGDRILIPALRWTNAVKHEGENLWKTDMSQIVAIRSQATGGLRPVNEYVLFTRTTAATSTTASGLFIIGKADDETTRGTVVAVSAKCDPELAIGATIFYNDPNFFSNFEFGGKTLSFIKEEEILAYAVD